ncbi:MAG TPA: TetR/AcrR family transcriptional regulator [Solirubrobacteraceae bacterium]|jgi:AcrR family transcriptional regulator
MAATSPTAPTPRPEDETVSTRERILDIALELFTEQGYDKTSIRDIAERLGFTKAALYYHFKSKADILLELHLRLHALGEQLLTALEALPDGEARAQQWPRLLDEFITAVDDNRQLVLMHQRNQNALEALQHSERHHAANDDIEGQIRRLLSDSQLPPATRVRMACSVGAVMTGLLPEGLVGDIPHDEKVRLVRATVADMFRDPA